MNIFRSKSKSKLDVKDIIAKVSKKFWDKLEPQISNGITKGSIFLKRTNKNIICAKMLEQVRLYINLNYLCNFELIFLHGICYENYKKHDDEFRFKFSLSDSLPEYDSIT